MDEAIITPVILSGGAGTRLWPLSCEQRPKQLLALTGAETMLQLTARRVADRARFAAPIVVAGAGHADEVESQLAAIGASPSPLIVEPVARNTAAAIALAALACDPGALMLVMPSDHVIADVDAFLAAVATGTALAGQGWLVTFGITPRRPDTGYGYIRRGAALSEDAFRVAAFIEKPNEATARRFLDEGGHDWNAGIFLFRADALLAAMERHAPDILAATRAAWASGTADPKHVRPDAALFAGVRAQSIDHAVMEKANRIAVVPVAAGWCDLGSWDASFAMSDKDRHGNALFGDVIAIDSVNCLLRADGRRLVAIGISDLIVIETPEATLIVPRGQSQRVREVVDALRVRDQR